VNTTPEPEVDLRLQASSPAQDYQSEGGAQGTAEKRPAQASNVCEQIVKDNDRAQGGQVTDEGVGKTGKKSGHPSEDGTRAICNKEGQAASWLKGLLPDPQSGWWEVGVKGKGFAVKFRWRDTARQTLLFPQITAEEFTSLKQSGYEESARILRERINANLYDFLLYQAKRDKALIVARKLGTNLDEYKIAGAKD
jgi:hypothetical protein